MKVISAPDFRQQNPYQGLLEEALEGEAVRCAYLTHYRRALPLYRGMAAHADASLLHLHWPESYFRPHSSQQAIRLLKYPFDLALTARRHPYVLTAHNLLAHDLEHFLARYCMRLTYRLARAVFAHSAPAMELIRKTHGVATERLVQIPFGDHAPPLGPRQSREAAREKLGLDSTEAIALAFGALSPYKGLGELIRLWKESKPEATLYLVGRARDQALLAELEALAGDRERIRIVPKDWLTEEELGLWLSAANCCVFNFRRILSSGSASLARSWGVPVVINRSSDSFELGEPSPLVLRYEEDAASLGRALEAALRVEVEPAAVEAWLDTCSWKRVAAITAATYKEIAA